MITRKKSGPYFKKFTQILRIENFKVMKNLLYLGIQKLPYLYQFLRYKGPLLDIILILSALKMMFSDLGSTTDIENFNFFSTPLGGGGVKKWNSIFAKIFILDI